MRRSQCHLLHHVQLAAHEQPRAVLLETLRRVSRRIHDFHLADVVILYRIQLKLLGLCKILTDRAVIICRRNLHRTFSLS